MITHTYILCISAVLIYIVAYCVYIDVLVNAVNSRDTLICTPVDACICREEICYFVAMYIHSWWHHIIVATH